MNSVIAMNNPAEGVATALERASTDAAFRREFLANPEHVLASVGYAFPTNKPLRVIDSDECHVLVLPASSSASPMLTSHQPGPELMSTLLADAPAQGVCKLHLYWWGQSLELSEDYMHYLEGLSSVAEAAAVIAAAIGGPLGLVLGTAFGVYLLAEGGAISLVDRGNGVFLNRPGPTLLIFPTAR